MDTLQTSSEPAQPVTVADLADLAAAVKRLQAGQRRTEAEQLRLARASDNHTTRIGSLFKVMRVSLSYAGLPVDPESPRPRARRPRAEVEQQARPALTVVGGSR